jgi:hypothetical protein
LASNDYKVVLGPHDLDSQNIQSLTTPALEQCYDFHVEDDVPSGIYWNETVALIAQGNYERLTTRQCFDITKVSNQAGYKLIIALTETLSVSDEGDAAILWTAYSGVQGGSTAVFSGAQLQKDMIARPFAMQNKSTYGKVSKCANNPALHHWPPRKCPKILVERLSCDQNRGELFAL